MKIEITVDIEATPEQVFYWLGDPERAKTWMTSVGRTEYIERTPDLIGSTFREYIQEEGRGTWMQGRIVDFAPNRRMAFYLEGDYNTADVVFTLEKVDGCTRVRQAADVRFKGVTRLLSLLFGRSFKRNIVRQSQQELAALKALCEGQHDAGDAKSTTIDTGRELT